MTAARDSQSDDGNSSPDDGIDNPYFSTRRDGRFTVVTLAARNNGLTEDDSLALRHAFECLVVPGQTRLIVDLEKVIWATSLLVSRLFVLQRRARDAGGEARLCNVRPAILDAFRVCRLESVFVIDSDLETALREWS